MIKKSFKFLFGRLVKRSTQQLDTCLPTPDYLDFSPPLLRLQQAPPNPLGRKVLWTLLILLVALIIWALIGKLDIVAVAQGKLIPQSYLKIVQPAEAGIVSEILVHEGDTVSAGQVLMRMDTQLTEADTKSLEAEFARKKMALRRIDAELNGTPFQILPDDPPGLVQETAAQYKANRTAIEAAIAEEKAWYFKARQDMAAAQQTEQKLADTLPHYREQENAFEKLAKEGFAGPLMASDKKRERIEKEQELKAQHHYIEAARANTQQSQKKMEQLESENRRQLYAERNETQSALERLEQELAKQHHRHKLLELRAPQNARVKDLSTHTPGTVVQPGTVLLTLVPQDDKLRAEVWVSNEDIGFVREGQTVKLKFSPFPFQKYGMAHGTVEHVSADAADAPSGQQQQAVNASPPPLGYKALIALDEMYLEMNDRRYALSVGMQTHAEILLGERTVFEYLLSPVKKAWHEAGRER